MFSKFSHKFSEINDLELLREIEAVGTIKEFKHGDVLMEVGSYIKSTPLMLEGLTKIVKEGNELLMYYISPGETCMVSLTCCMIEQKSEIKAVVEEDSLMLMIPIQYMDEWMIKYKDWKSFVMNSYRKRFEELFTTIDSIAFHKLDDRLILYLKNKAKAKSTLTLKATHQDIAYDLNSSREVISRLLKQLEREGKIILSRNQIELTPLFS
jgi:CRP/FNR family transcriptional regulator